MSFTIHDNQISGERQLRTLSGRRLYKTLIASGIPLTYLAEERIDYAIDNCGYAIGDLHPEYLDAKIISIEAKALSDDTVEIEIEYYEADTDVTVSIASNTYQSETNVDADGDLLEVSYTYPADYALDTSLQGVTISKSPTMSKDMSEVIVTLSHNRVITSSDVIVMALTYKDTLNQAGWTVSPGAEEGVWRCLDISGDSNGDGTYAMTYQFSARKFIQINGTEYISGHTFDLYYKDERTGEPPADIVVYQSLTAAGEPNVSPGGIKIGQSLYPKKNFNNIVSI